MQFANILVAVCMLLLGYGVFVFIAETKKPTAIPAKETSDSDKRRYHLFGLLAGVLVFLSSIAAWVLGTGSFFAGLKASFIVAVISLLLLLAAYSVLNWFLKSRNTEATDAQHLVDGEEQQADVDIGLTAENIVEKTAVEKELEEKIELIQQEHKAEILDKTKSISELESSVADLRNERDTLTEKIIRLDDVEAELSSAKNELATLKQSSQETLGLSESTIETLKAQNLNLQTEVEQVKELRLELESSRTDFNKLKSEFESDAKLRSENEQREKELQYKLHQAALKERAGRLKMEVSAKRALGIARQAVSKLDNHEKKLTR